MARRRNHFIANPNLNEFFYQIFLNLTQEDKKFLTMQELRKISPTFLRSFVADSPLDERLLLAGKIGFRSYIIVAPDRWNVNKMKKLYLQFQKNGDRSELIQALVDEKVFVVGSDSMLLSASFMNRNCQSDYWIMNRNFQKVYKLWDMMGKNLGVNRIDSDTKEISSGASYLLETIFTVHHEIGRFADLGLQKEMDMSILMCLLRKTKRKDYKTVFTLDKEIFNECNNGNWKKQRFTVRLNWLNNNGYIEKGMGRDFAISDRGVIVVMEYVKKIAEIITYNM